MVRGSRRRKTGATLQTVLVAESFVPKFERSKTRKRESDAEKGEKIAERKKRQKSGSNGPTSSRTGRQESYA
jgi:hypothetical protein